MNGESDGRSDEKTKTYRLGRTRREKKDLLEWAKFNAKNLAGHELWATGTTGRTIKEHCGLEISLLKSGPLGGDQQLGAKIANGELDILIFFWDPMTAQPHDVDVKALLRMSVLYNVAVACNRNRSTADFIISSTSFDDSYDPILKDYSRYIRRKM